MPQVLGQVVAMVASGIGALGVGAGAASAIAGALVYGTCSTGAKLYMAELK